jgi:hypothetical protein
LNNQGKISPSDGPKDPKLCQRSPFLRE